MKVGIPLLQLFGSAGIIALIPGNQAKVVALLLLWVLTFWPVSSKEIVLYAGGCVLFTVMNALALRQGVFHFIHPDLLGMPYYEFFMWGFYLLHTHRALKSRIISDLSPVAIFFVFAFGLAFSLITNSHTLFFVTAAILACSFLCFHERADFLYFAYMVMVGIVIEYVGISSAQWAYPDHPPGGVPLWFITMWGGVGLYLRRVALPVLYGRFKPGTIS